MRTESELNLGLLILIPRLFVDRAPQLIARAPQMIAKSTVCWHKKVYEVIQGGPKK